MKNLPYHLSILFLFTTLSLVVSCGGGGDDDDDPPMPTGNQMVYELDAVGSSGVSGTVTFAKLGDNSISVKLI